jgi:hypothetical protein
MQFLTTITIGHTSAPPQALQTAMTKLVDDATAAGTLVLSGGLAPSAQGRLVSLARGELTVRDSATSQVPIDGFAVFEAASMDEAIERAAQLLQLHQEYMPNWEGECTVRPIVTHCLP